MDPTVQVALISVITGFITTLGLISVAYINKKDSSGGDLTLALRERITLKDEQIAELKEDLKDKDEKIAELQAIVDDRQRGVTP